MIYISLIIVDVVVDQVVLLILDGVVRPVNIVLFVLGAGTAVNNLESKCIRCFNNLLLKSTLFSSK